jgi:ketosteroid isomerase-like protein
VDQFEIQQTISRYHQSASLADWDTMVATFAPDGVWELLRFGRKFVGRQEIREAIGSLTGALDYVVQVNAPALIQLDGDTATATSAIRESGKYAGKDEGLEAFGIYHDRLIRTGEGWRFAVRAFETRWTQRVPLIRT